MTKKKRQPVATPQSNSNIDLPKPLLALRLTKGGPLENGRVWVGADTLTSCSLSPGTPLLLSIGPQPPVKNTGSVLSAFAPISTSIDDFSLYPPVSLRQKWMQTDEDCRSYTGDFCIGGDVWPNAGVRKGEVQISECLAANLQHPTEGSILYMHPVTEINACVSLILKYCHSIPIAGEDRKQWLEDVLSEKGETQLKILKTLISRQLNGRLILQRNTIPVLLMGCSLLFEVFYLESQKGPIAAAVVDGDNTAIKLDMQQTGNTALTEESSEMAVFLDEVGKHAGAGFEGNRKEAAISGARESARCGLSVLNNTDVNDVILSEDLARSLSSLVELPLAQPALFSSMGLSPPHGVLLYGPPGSGKTISALWIAKKLNANLFLINGPSLLSEYYGESESMLAGIFQAASALSPSLVFIDEIDAVTPSRGGVSLSNSMVAGGGESSARLMTTLLSQFDRFQGHQVMVLAATNRLESIDEALRRPGRFDREIEMALPTPAHRRDILKKHLQRVEHSLTENEIAEIAFGAHGFLPADIAALSREAGLVALRRNIDGMRPLKVTTGDFERAALTIRPSGLREFQTDIPEVRWEDIGGLDDVKQRIRESVQWPITHAASLQRLGTTAPKGILLFGPPGCSKTMLARAAATETGMNFISISGSELLNTFVGESEKAIARLFSRARLLSPCIIFMDEVDGFLNRRDDFGDDGTSLSQRILSQILSEMDGVRDRGQVIMIGATNKPQLIDGAMLRPGRFDRLIFVPPPNPQSRQSILEILFRTMSIDDDVNVQELSEKTENFTGADLVCLCREAGIRALEQNLQAPAIHMEQFLDALKEIKPSLGDEYVTEIEMYQAFQRSAT